MNIYRKKNPVQRASGFLWYHIQEKVCLEILRICDPIVSWKEFEEVRVNFQGDSLKLFCDRQGAKFGLDLALNNLWHIPDSDAVLLIQMSYFQ